MDVRRWASRVASVASRPFQLDLRSLALFRVGLGLLVVFDLINRGLWLRAHYTDWGVMPRGALLETSWDPAWVSIHMWNGTLWPQALLFVLAGVVAVALIVGYRTRLTTFLSWFLLISLQARNPLVLQGGDIAFRLLLFWGMFLPLGARGSVDAALDGESTESESSTFVSAGTVAFVAQLCFIYVFAAILKDAPEWRIDFTAAYYALSLEQFTTPLGDLLYQQESLLKPVTIVTFLLEGGGWLLLLMPFWTNALRILATLLFVGMHMSFAASMQLGLFSYIVSIGWLAMLPPSVWRWLTSVWPERPEVVVYVPRRGGPADRLGRVAQVGLFLSVEFEYGDDPSAADRWGVEVDGGRRACEWDGFVRLLGASPVAWPVAKVARIGWVERTGRRLWRAASRRMSATSLSGWLPLRSHRATTQRSGTSRWQPRLKPTLVGSLFVLAASGTAFWWNLQTVDGKWSIVQPIRTWAVYLRIDQKWNMFAPYPLEEDGWYVIPGELRDGTEVGLFRGTDEPDFDKPEDVSATYPNQRWRKYMMNLWLAEHSDKRLWYGKYLCRRWNSNHGGEKTLMTFDIYFVEESSLPGYQEAELDRKHLWSHHCFEDPNSEEEENDVSEEVDDSVVEDLPSELPGALE